MGSTLESRLLCVSVEDAHGTGLPHVQAQISYQSPAKTLRPRVEAFREEDFVAGARSRTDLVLNIATHSDLSQP